jgi:hypothetical protein
MHRMKVRSEFKSSPSGFAPRNLPPRTGEVLKQSFNHRHSPDPPGTGSLYLYRKTAEHEAVRRQGL